MNTSLIDLLESDIGCQLLPHQRKFVEDIVSLPSFNAFGSLGSGKTYVLMFIEELMRRNPNYVARKNTVLDNVDVDALQNLDIKHHQDNIPEYAKHSKINFWTAMKRDRLPVD